MIASGILLFVFGIWGSNSLIMHITAPIKENDTRLISRIVLWIIFGGVAIAIAALLGLAGAWFSSVILTFKKKRK